MGAVLLIWCATGCSSFERRWEASDQSVTATRWDGRWESAKHRTGSGQPVGGRLRAVIEPAPAPKLTVYFHANWSFFASDYAMTLEPTSAGPRGGPARDFQGAHKLPKFFGGTYRYTARISGDDFAARYTSSYDRGTFTLRRVPAAKECLPKHSGH